MNNPKLLEAIAELEFQRRVIDDAIVHLRKAHDALSGSPTNIGISVSDSLGGSASYIDQAVDALQAAGKELHISLIVESITKARGESVARASVESSLIRHQAKAAVQRIIKVGRSTYDLPERRPQPTLTQLAS